MFKKWGIASRMVVFFLLGVGLILGSIVYYGYSYSRKMLEQEMREKTMYLASATSGKIDAVARAVEKVAESAAFKLQGHKTTNEQTRDFLTNIIYTSNEVFGSAFALPEENGFLPQYAYRNDGKVTTKELDSTYVLQDWYTLPKELKRPIWSEPYFDEFGGEILMSTYSFPIIDKNQGGNFSGLITCDISLEWLNSIVSELHIGQSGYAFIISANGTFISSLNKEFIMNETIFSIAEAANDKGLRELGRQMIHKQSGFVPFRNLKTGQPEWLAYDPVGTSGWSLGIAFSEAELMARVWELSKVEILIGVIGFVLLFIVIILIARSITKPIRQLDDSVKKLAKQGLDTVLPVIKGKDEVARLSSSFVTMQKELKDYIEKLKQTVSAKERLESELSIAHEIQMSLVPKDFPPFPERHDFDIYAILEPAKQVGGDLYDFFMLDQDHICLLVGDVSGKGVPAALFMAVTRTFLRAFFSEDKSPARVIGRLNDEISKNNDASMFVTLFAAVIDIKNEKCIFANAGHNLPFILRASGEVDKLPKTKGAVAGGLEGINFEEETIDLKNGDLLFIYTDGVTEAMNCQEQLFGDDRTMEALKGSLDMNCEGALKNVRKNIRDFVGAAEQYDDITMLAFRLKGKK